MNSNLLDYKAKTMGLSVADVANALGVDESTYYRKRSGRTDFTRNELRILRDLLNLSAEEMNEIFFAE